MVINIEIDGFGKIEAEYLVSDLNGTLAMFGKVSPETKKLIKQLKSKLKIFILSADTFNNGKKIADDLGVGFHKISGTKSQAFEKCEFIQKLDPEKSIVMGNGRNDYMMFQKAKLAFGIMGEEGINPKTLKEADLVVNSPENALKMLLNPIALKAGLRE